MSAIHTVWATGISLVGVATRYRLDGWGFKQRWVPDSPYHLRPALGPAQPYIKRVAGVLVPGVKQPRRAGLAWPVTERSL